MSLSSAKIRDPISGLRQKIRVFIKNACPNIGKFNTDVLRNKTILVRCQNVPDRETRPSTYEGYELCYTQKP